MTDDEIITEVIGERLIDDSFSSGDDDDKKSDSQSSVSDTKAFDTNPVHLLLVKK